MSPLKNLEHASAVTYVSASATLTFWGLHLSDFAIIVSACATVVGVGCQIWVAVTKVRLMRRAANWKLGDD